MPKKYCYKCKHKKLFSDFNKNRSTDDGFQNMCRACHQAYANQSSPKNNAIKINVKWHPKAEPRLLWAHQKNCCAICGAPQGARRLHRDHNHRTGWLRGLLCANCNHRLPSKYCDGSLLEARMYLEGQNCFTEKYIKDCLYYLENPPYFRMLELKRIERPTGTYEEFIANYRGHPIVPDEEKPDAQISQQPVDQRLFASIPAAL